MTKNPIYNAFAAAAYIFLVASVMFYGARNASNNSVIVPVAMISLFTLSASVMAYVFGYQPFQLYFDGKKKQALDLVLQTIAIFAGITIVILSLLFSGVLR